MTTLAQRLELYERETAAAADRVAQAERDNAPNAAE